MKGRNIGAALVLTIITCGLYGVYWFIVLTDDVKRASGDQEFPSGGMAFLLSLVTCGIYTIYWAYKMGKGLMIAKQNNNLLVEDNSVLYLILQIVGLGIVNYALIQNELNQISKIQMGG